MAYEDNISPGVFFGWSALGILILSAVVAVGMYGCPQYKVYHARLSGEAELAQAQQNRQIAVNEAMAKLESSKLLAGAEVERAKGVAQANKIIGDGLKDNEAYLRYLYITEGLGTNVSKEIVYVPTEAQIPILEAGRGSK